MLTFVYELSMNMVWLAAAIILLIVEGLAPGLVSIWFALGALAAMVSAMLGAPLWLQLVWFALVSVVSLILTRPLAKRYVNARAVRTNADMAIGQDCVVTEAIDNVLGRGAVSVGGRIEGVKLIVEKIKN